MNHRSILKLNGEGSNFSLPLGQAYERADGSLQVTVTNRNLRDFESRSILLVILGSHECLHLDSDQAVLLC